MYGHNLRALKLKRILKSWQNSKKTSLFYNLKRIEQIAQYVLDNFKQKTHRFNAGNNGFNAMFAVSSVDAAKAYYQTFKQLQSAVKIHLKLQQSFRLPRMKSKMRLAILLMKVLK